MGLFQLQFPQDMCSVVGLLGHMSQCFNFTKIMAGRILRSFLTLPPTVYIIPINLMDFIPMISVCFLVQLIKKRRLFHVILT